MFVAFSAVSNLCALPAVGMIVVVSNVAICFRLVSRCASIWHSLSKSFDVTMP